MKILLNGLQVNNQNSGVQYYVKNLYEALLNTNSKEPEIHFLSNNVFSKSNNSRLRRIFFENFILPGFITDNSFNLYHAPSYILPPIVPSFSVVTIHDLITFDFPKLCQNVSVVYFKLFLPQTIKKADKIIAVSETVKNDILKRFKIPDYKISVIHLGINSLFKKTIDPEIPAKYGITQKYILFVGNIEPKKNLVRLIQSYHRLYSGHTISHKLVIAGKNGWKYMKVYKTVEKLELQDQVIFTGYIPEKDLPALYSMASLFIFPSIYEGFGIPPLEAMACEVPVLASDRGALPETTGGNALLVDPYSIEKIAEGIYQLLTDETLRQHYIAQGKKWVNNFTWEKAAQKTLAIYQETLSGVKYNLSSQPQS